MNSAHSFKVIHVPSTVAGSFAEALSPYMPAVKRSDRLRLIGQSEPFDVVLDTDEAANDFRSMCGTYGVQLDSARVLKDDDWGDDDAAIAAAEAAPVTTSTATTAPAEDLDWLDDTGSAEAAGTTENDRALAGTLPLDPSADTVPMLDPNAEAPAKKTRKPRAKKVEAGAPAEPVEESREATEEPPALHATAEKWLRAVVLALGGDHPGDEQEQRRAALEACEAEDDLVLMEAVLELSNPLVMRGVLHDAVEARVKALRQAELDKGDAPPEVEIISERQEYSFERQLIGEDYRELGMRAAEAARRAADLKTELDRTSKRLKGAIEVAVGEAADAQSAILAGKRTITVEVRLELRTDGMVHLVRLDTGEVVEVRPLTESERQRSLFGQAPKTDGVETSDADDDGWADEA